MSAHHGKWARRNGLATLLLGLSAALPAALPAAAHHSFATFDQEKTVVLEGTIKTVEWANPHVWIWIVVKDSSGNAVPWGIESTPPSVLARLGWRPDSLKAGDNASITIHPLKSGEPGGSLLKAVKGDGTVLATRREDVVPAATPQAAQ
ncbi:MAG: DUF6152 family protein [Steroidobacteraceae bacterium]